MQVRVRVYSARSIIGSFGNTREGTRRGDFIQRWTRDGAGRVDIVDGWDDDDVNNGRLETRWWGTKTSELIMLRPTELVVRDEAVLVLVLMLEDLLDELIVISQHFLYVFSFTNARLLGFYHLLSEIIAHLQTKNWPCTN